MAASSPWYLEDLVAQTTLDLYSSFASASTTHLPIRNGALEWTILSSVSLVISSPHSTQEISAPQVIPISMGTGTKTTPYENLRGTPGDVLHDLHAEVLARRGARRWIVNRIALETQWYQSEEGLECKDQTHTLLDGLPLVLQRGENCRRWKLKEGIKVWWYVSTLPCGECSTHQLERERARVDAGDGGVAQIHQPRRAHVATVAFSRDTANASNLTPVLRGRQITLPASTPRARLRTVPGRPDSPPSLCHSCTDKLLLWSLIGWQGAALARLLTGRLPIDGLVIGVGESEVQEADAAVALAAEIRSGLDVRQRCDDSGSELQSQMETAGLPIDLVPPPVLLTTLPFSQSQASVRSMAHKKGIQIEECTSPRARLRPGAHERDGAVQGIALVPAWESSSYIRPSSDTIAAAAFKIDPHKGKLEKLIYGIKQGATPKRRRRLPDHPLAYESKQDTGHPPLYEKSRSRLCKLEHLRLLHDICQKLDMSDIRDVNPSGTYVDLKGKRCEGGQEGIEGEWYRRSKALLRGEGTGHERPTWSMTNESEERTIDSWLRRATLVGKARKAVEQGEDEGSGGQRTQDSQDGDPSSSSSAAYAAQIGRAPLQGWLITPRSLEDFDCEGIWAAAQPKEEDVPPSLLVQSTL